MISIFLSINNNEEVIELPVIPEKLENDSPFNNDSFEGMNQELNLVGTRGNKTMSIDSFFPVTDYPFLRSRELWGMEYVETIERWRDRRYPLRLIIANTNPKGYAVNLAVTIDDFTYGVGISEDIEYSLSLREFPIIRVGG
ncbi:hypothetical protein [Chengkuizengella marina]|uniref:Uncharacterized protein n=1 Tax=Chengkuizengella marina TaxID=2507566 RepID=A0A6N9Q879_9BACL|nr:hypothetical protein [Chengkuizengella marina]NBI30901.1 hypothetical protein [Chengkuizengella marina]